MNVYDFDKTIFYPDSSCRFILYCFRRYPRFLLQKIPDLLQSKTTEELKENLFSVISCVDDIDSFVKSFWDSNYKLIQSWYLVRKREDDLIISASPDFLIDEIASRLGVSFIATPMNKFSGKIMGSNCHDYEKVERFKRHYSGKTIENFYSDSRSDRPLAELAQNAFLVKNGKLSKWRFI